MTKSLIDEIVANMPERRASLPWWQRLDDRQQKIAAEILAAWKAGRLGTKKKPACIGIATTLGRYGVTIGQQGVRAWLDANAT